MDRGRAAFEDRQRQVIQNPASIRFPNGDVFELDVSIKARVTIGAAFNQLCVQHARRIELLDDCLVPQAHILRLIVVGEQLSPRARQVFKGRQRGHQCPDGQVALDDEISADGEKEERRHLRNQIVDELHEEFFLIDLIANIEQAAQPVTEMRHCIRGDCVGANVFDACDGFANPLGKQANFFHPLFVQQIDLALQLGDQPSLQRDEGDGRQPQPNALDEQKEENGQHLPGLEHGLRDGISHDTAERFGLARDNRDHLSLRGSPKVR